MAGTKKNIIFKGGRGKWQLQNNNAVLTPIGFCLSLTNYTYKFITLHIDSFSNNMPDKLESLITHINSEYK